MTTSQLLAETIDIFLEYRDKHGYDEIDAKTKAVSEILQGVNSNAIDAILGQQSALRNQLTEVQRELGRLVPQCEFGCSGYPSLRVQDSRDRYEKLAAKSAELEVALGY